MKYAACIANSSKRRQVELARDNMDGIVSASQPWMEIQSSMKSRMFN